MNESFRISNWLVSRFIWIDFRQVFLIELVKCSTWLLWRRCKLLDRLMTVSFRHPVEIDQRRRSIFSGLLPSFICNTSCHLIIRDFSVELQKYHRLMSRRLCWIDALRCCPTGPCSRRSAYCAQPKLWGCELCREFIDRVTLPGESAKRCTLLPQQKWKVGLFCSLIESFCQLKFAFVMQDGYSPGMSGSFSKCFFVGISIFDLYNTSWRLGAVANFCDATHLPNWFA